MTALWGRGVLRQRKTKIDRRLIQNPAYGPVVFYNKSAPHAVKILCAGLFRVLSLRQHRIIPALRLKHRYGGCGTASALPKMLDNTQSIICAFGLAAAAPRSPYRHLELCGIALENRIPTIPQGRRPSVRRSFYNKSTTIKQRQFMACGLQKSAYIDRRIIFASNNDVYMIK